MIKLVTTGSYNKDLSTMTGSIVASIILEKTLEWWRSQGRKEFYLFIKPCDHEKYNNGRSWKEIAGLTSDDLKYGMSIVGTRITEKQKRHSILLDTKPQFDTSGKLLNTSHLILYSRRAGVTYYELNEQLAERAISAFSSGEWRNFIAPSEPTKIPEKKRLTEEEATKISAFSDFIIPPSPEGEDNAE